MTHINTDHILAVAQIVGVGIVHAAIIFSGHVAGIVRAQGQITYRYRPHDFILTAHFLPESSQGLVVQSAVAKGNLLRVGEIGHGFFYRLGRIQGEAGKVNLPVIAGHGYTQYIHFPEKGNFRICFQEGLKGVGTADRIIQGDFFHFRKVRQLLEKL